MYFILAPAILYIVLIVYRIIDVQRKLLWRFHLTAVWRVHWTRISALIAYIDVFKKVTIKYLWLNVKIFFIILFFFTCKWIHFLNYSVSFNWWSEKWVNCDRSLAKNLRLMTAEYQKKLKYITYFYFLRNLTH